MLSLFLLIGVLLSLLATLAISGRVGWYLILQVLYSDPGLHRLPAWIEAAAPLKGRWLRLLLAMPLILIKTIITFLALAIVLATTSVVLGPMMILAAPALILVAYSAIELPTAAPAQPARIGVGTE